MNDSLQSKMSGTDRPVLYSALAYAGILILGLVLAQTPSFTATGPLSDVYRVGVSILWEFVFFPLLVTIQGNPFLVLFGIEGLIVGLSVVLMVLLPFFTGWFAARGTLRQDEQAQFTTPGQSAAIAGLCATTLGSALASLLLLVVSYFGRGILEAFLFVILSILASMLLGALGGYAHYLSYRRKQSHITLTPPAMPAAA